MNKTVYQQIEALGIIPVVIIENEKHAAPLAEVLCDTGIPCAEITFRTSAAAASIKHMVDARPDMLVGAGTVINAEQAREAIGAGAKFIVSPGVNTKVIELCLKEHIPVIPGVVTPTEILTALEQGINVVKFFPAESCGGIQYLKALSAPFGGVRFIPTGGIDDSSLLQYLGYPPVLACGGSWMVRQDAISCGNFDDIRTICRHVMSVILGFELRHVGINTPDPSSAGALSQRLSEFMNIDLKDGNSSIFVGPGFEILKKNYLGKHGHLALGTNSVMRALSWLERKGIRTKPDTENIRDGRIMTVYLDIDLGGFAVHLVQK